MGIEAKRSSTEVRSHIEALLDRAEATVPLEHVAPLPPSEGLLGEPRWHSFEHEIWELGEDIRQALLERPRLRADPELQERFLALATDRRSLRGRQSFVMLLGFRSCSRHAARLAAEVDDPSVDGHVVSTIYKMRAPGFTAAIGPLQDHEKTWIKREAKRYVAWDAQQGAAR